MPLIIAGPILRQVTERSVTVWLVTQTKVDVTLSVYDRDVALGRLEMGNGKRATVALGTHCHVVAVTARINGALSEATNYFYDLILTTHGPPISQHLVEALTKPGAPQDPKKITYGTFVLPSFALPPKDLNNLRLIQGSCRKPNGGANDKQDPKDPPDALGLLDALIEADVSNPLLRPHQLLLTGDQIYADEVADVLLAMLMDAVPTLFGWSEELPGGTNSHSVAFGPYTVSQLAPSTREAPIYNAQFTTQDTRSHVMTLCEYIAMYLFVWSDDLFVESPTIAEFKVLYPDVNIKRFERSMDSQRKSVEKFRETLPEVRRALANIPTYMGFDDHEVTDDWNMTRSFCDNVYDNPLGTRVIQNGLIAFSICQMWGNLPEMFWDGSSAPGATLLVQLEAIAKSEIAGTRLMHAFDAQFQSFMGINKPSALAGRTPYGVFHDLGPKISVQGAQIYRDSLQFHFSAEGPSHQVVFTDGRTWREFPIKGNESHPDLIGLAELNRQLQADLPNLNDRLLIISVSTNMPPTVGIRTAAYTGAAINHWVGKRAGPVYYKMKREIYDNDLNDSWEFPALATDRFVVAVSNKLIAAGTPVSQVVLISGDVHFSFASRLAYWAEKQRLGDTPHNKKTPKFVFAQLVGSALKNEKTATRGLQYQGYGYTTAGWQKPLMFPLNPAGYVGWNILSGSKKVGLLAPGIIRSGQTLQATSDMPTLMAPLEARNNVELSQKPDYRFRLDYLKTVATGQSSPATRSIPTASGADRAEVMRGQAKATSAYRDLVQSGAAPPEVVGFNNLGDIKFTWQRANGTPATSANDANATNKLVHYTLRWQPSSGPAQWARYDVSAMVDDANYPKLLADVE
jgi:hypothetical protein